MYELGKTEKEMVRIVKILKYKNTTFERAIRSILSSSFTVRRKLNLLRHIFGCKGRYSK